MDGEKIILGILGAVGIFLMVALIATVAFGIYDAATGYSCYARTAEIDFPVKYSFASGCRVEVEPGKWIPISNYYYPDKNKQP